VHFSWYFRYMEEAEHALWREAGLSILTPSGEIGWPRVAASFDFHSPLRFEQEFDVLIRVAAIGRKTIRYTCLISAGDRQVATGTMVAVCVRTRPDEPARSVEIPPEIAGRFQVAPEPNA
jgi:acyl-CoA thioesterase FadM